MRYIGWRGVSAAAVLGLAACDETSLSPRPEADSLAVTPASLELLAGDQAPLAVQVFEQGQPLAGAGAVFWSENADVAGVSPAGVVRGVAVGETRVWARHGAAQAAAAVRVRDPGDVLRTLDLVESEVNVDFHPSTLVVVRFHAENGRGEDVCDRIALSIRADAAVARAANATTGPGSCRLHVVTIGPGETYVVASAGGLADSVRVHVTAGGYQAAFVDPERPPITPWDLYYPGARIARVGDTMTYSVRVTAPGSRPVAGWPVEFTATSGQVAAPVELTGADGIATVRWVPPPHIRSAGPWQSLTFRTRLPNGATVTDSRTFALVPRGARAAIELYVAEGDSVRLAVDSVRVPAGRDVTLWAVPVDEFGNALESRSGPSCWVTFTAGDPSIFAGVGPGGAPAHGDTPYSYCIAGVVVHSSGPPVWLRASSDEWEGEPTEPSRTVVLVFVP